MDCTGQRCHAECELRHLDAAERQRDASWAWPETPKLIVCAGPERSGSTWLYNAVRLLHSRARVPCDSYWLHTITEDKLDRRLQEGAHVCVKTHEWEPEYASLIPARAARVILTHRDLRGVVASYRRAGWLHRIDRKYIDDHMEWKKISTMDVQYEDVIRDGEAQVKAVAEHLGLALPDAELVEVHKALKSMQPGGGGGVDQVTKMWPGHISASTRKNQDNTDAKDQELNKLADEQYSERLRQDFRDYFDTYGYA